MKTYEIKSEIYELTKLLETEEFDPETGELIDNSEALAELSEEINMLKEEKCDNIAYLIKEYSDTEVSISAEIKRLQDRKKTAANAQAKLKELIDFLLSGEKVKTDRFTFFYAKTKSTVIDDESAIPSDYWKYEPKLDKSALNAALKTGEIPGAHVEEKISLRIK